MSQSNLQTVYLTIRGLDGNGPVKVKAACVYRGIDTGRSSCSGNTTLYDVTIGGITVDGEWNGDARNQITASCSPEQAEAIFRETRPNLARACRKEMGRLAVIAERRAARAARA